MSQVILKNFNADKDWQSTRDRTTENLVSVGALFGDEEALMRAKADRIYALLRRIVDDVPAVQVSLQTPSGLSDEQLSTVHEAIELAARKGVETAMTHSVQVLMKSIYDLCTSKLRTPRPTEH